MKDLEEIFELPVFLVIKIGKDRVKRPCSKYGVVIHKDSYTVINDGTEHTIESMFGHVSLGDLGVPPKDTVHSE